MAVFAGDALVVDTSKLAVGSSSVSLGGQQGAAHSSEVELSSSVSLGGQHGAAHSSEVGVSSSASLGGQQGAAHSSGAVVSSGLARVES